MSIRAMNWAMSVIEDCGDMTSKAAHVLTTMAWCHNQETGRCDPSISLLTKRSKLSRDTVIRAVKELEELSVISTVKRKVRTSSGTKNLRNSYKLNRAWGSSTVRLGVVAGCDPIRNNTLRGRCAKNPSAFDDLVMMIDEGDLA